MAASILRCSSKFCGNLRVFADEFKRMCPPVVTVIDSNRRFHGNLSGGHNFSGHLRENSRGGLLSFTKNPFANTCNDLGARSFQSGHEDEEENDGRQLYFHDHGWMIRLANENSYLSWCRNVYIATIAGATAYSQILMVPYAKEAGILLIFMGALNILSGTSSYMYNVIKLRRRMHMSGLSVFYSLTMALTHMLLWVGAMMIYLGYVEEEPEQAAGVEEERTV